MLKHPISATSLVLTLLILPLKLHGAEPLLTCRQMAEAWGNQSPHAADLGVCCDDLFKRTAPEDIASLMHAGKEYRSVGDGNLLCTRVFGIAADGKRTLQHRNIIAGRLTELEQIHDIQISPPVAPENLPLIFLLAKDRSGESVLAFFPEFNGNVSPNKMIRVPPSVPGTLSLLIQPRDQSAVLLGEDSKVRILPLSVESRSSKSERRNVSIRTLELKNQLPPAVQIIRSKALKALVILTTDQGLHAVKDDGSTVLLRMDPLMRGAMRMHWSENESDQTVTARIRTSDGVTRDWIIPASSSPDK